VSGEPAAFMSYARFNDEHDDGQLTQLRMRLSAEVGVQTGLRDFVIFQDRNDIAWGQNWQSRIDETLDASTLLLAVITPSFFRSSACRSEVERFLRREQDMGREGLILPLYYVSTPELDEPARREADPLAQIMISRQFADWRELRFEPFTAPVVRKALAQLASRMRDTFWLDAQTPQVKGGRRAAMTASTGVSSAAEADQSPGRLMRKTEPPTHVVDAYQRGDFSTIKAAIDAAKPGDRILVRPGLYQEGLVIDKPLEILGDGPVADISIRARDADVVLFQTNIGRISNLTLRQVGGRGRWFGVDITQGRLEMEGCDISSDSLACVAIQDGADPRLRRNRLHDGEQGGVYVLRDGLGTLEDNEISGNALAGVEIAAGGNPILRRNQIRDGKSTGVLVRKGGLGTFEDNDITGNADSGVEIRSGGDPILRRNQIRDGKSAGVFVDEGGLGTFEDNDITGNADSGVEIGTAGNPTVRRNRINRNRKPILVRVGGSGVIADNDLTDNLSGAEIVRLRPFRGQSREGRLPYDRNSR
jgi:parallel beta-helix repeat protein